jgi:anti-sigma factor ChrR (cupin superfamily)
MTELFKAADSTSSTITPDVGSVYLASGKHSWQAGGVDGFWIKKLWQNADDTERTWLMKIDPGALAPSHAHDEVEQIYVLEGSFYDDDHRMGPGDFICRAPGTLHIAGSETGAIVLLVYTKPLFTGATFSTAK